MNRHGYVLLGVLWLTAGITGVGILLSTAVRDAVSSARNRTALIEAEWTAEACLAQARGAAQEAIDGAARDPRTPGATIWNRLDEVVHSWPAGLPETCTLSMRALGSRLNVNHAEPTVIASVLRMSELPTERADSLAALIVERRAARPFRHPEELMGLVTAPEGGELGRLFDVHAEPLSLNHLPPAILATLPGLTEETVGRVATRRARGEVFTTFLEMGEGVSPSSREALVRAIPHLANVVTFVPPAWVLEADVKAGTPPVRVRTEVHLARAGGRVVVTGRRTWIP